MAAADNIEVSAAEGTLVVVVVVAADMDISEMVAANNLAVVDVLDIDTDLCGMDGHNFDSYSMEEVVEVAVEVALRTDSNTDLVGNDRTDSSLDTAADIVSVDIDHTDWDSVRHTFHALHTLHIRQTAETQDVPANANGHSIRDETARSTVSRSPSTPSIPRWSLV